MQNLLFRYFWVLFIAVSLIDLKISRNRINRRFYDNDEKRALGRKLWKGFAVYSLLPWVVMGIAILAGGLPSIFSFLVIWPFNPWIWLFLVTAAGCWASAGYWLFFRDGAEILMDFNGIFVRNMKSPKMLKTIYLLSGAGAVAAVVFLSYWQSTRACLL